MKLSGEQYEFIKGEVVSVFDHYDIRCIPISGFELAYKMGIKLIPYILQGNRPHILMKLWGISMG